MFTTASVPLHCWRPCPYCTESSYELALPLCAPFIQFKAKSDIANEMGHTPQFIAEAAKNMEAAKLISSWSRVVGLYSTEEYVWFLCLRAL